MDKDIYTTTMEAAAYNLIDIGRGLIKEGQSLLRRTGRLTIGVVSRWCNDEMIAPFFLDHYSFADEIVILLSSDTTDKSREIIAKYPNARVIEFEYPMGRFNAKEANDIIHQTTDSMVTDWIIAVDADELVFAKGFEDVHEVLATVNGNVVYTDFWNVYKHRSEMDLDPTLKAVWLRRHGDPNRNADDGRYRKPVVVRSGFGFRWSIGLHVLYPGPEIRISKTRLDGAHWRMADPILAIARRMRGRRENLSMQDIINQCSSDNFDVTKRDIINECEAHLDDPQLF